MFGIPAGDFALLVGALLAAGALTGVLAGLFGVGGGAIIVPVLYELFRLLGVEESVRMPLCVGTSLAIIVPTAINSFRGHLKKKVADLSVLRAWAVPVVVGVAVGSLVARYATPEVFKIAFVLVAGINAIKLLFGRESWRVAADLPKGPLMWTYGWVIGLLSSLMGIGGGALANLVMSFHGRPIHQGVATGAGLGVLIAVPGAIGYMIAGWPKMELLPPLSLGFVSLIGFLMMAPASVLTTPVGVRLAHAWSKRRLEIAFGLFLSAMCLRFLVGMFV